MAGPPAVLNHKITRKGIKRDSLLTPDALGRDRQAFAAKRPKRPALPNAGTGHTPSSSCRIAGACRAIVSHAHVAAGNKPPALLHSASVTSRRIMLTSVKISRESNQKHFEKRHCQQFLWRYFRSVFCVIAPKWRARLLSVFADTPE
jgi:hypothetical protein